MAIDEDYDRWDAQEAIDLQADYEFACEMDREIRTAQIERQNTTCDEASYGVLRPVMEV